MKKHILSLALMLALVIAFIPSIPASAVSGPVYLESDIMGTRSQSQIISYPASGSFSMDGETYFRGVATQLNYIDVTMSYNIAGRGFRRLSGTVGRVDGSARGNGTSVGALTITGDGKLLGGFEIDSGGASQIEVAIPAGTELIVLNFQPYLDDHNNGACIGIGNAFFDSVTPTMLMTPPPAAPDAVYLQNDIMPSQHHRLSGSYPESGAFSMGGITYFRGMYQYAVQRTITYNISDYGFTKLTSTFGGSGTLIIYGDGKLLEGFSLKWGDAAIKITVDIPMGVQEISIGFAPANDNRNTYIILADAYFSGGRVKPATPIPPANPVTRTITATFGATRYTLNGEPFTQESIVYGGIAYLPAAYLATRLGLSARWDAATNITTLTSTGVRPPSSSEAMPPANPVTRTITATFGGTRYILNDELLDEDTMVYNGVAYLPAAYLATKLGLTARWDAATNITTLTSK